MAEARRYRLLGLIGEGGFGRVYRAELSTADGFQKQVAIKLLKERDPDPDLLMRFRDEARILGLLRDRAIVSVDPPTRLGGHWAVVMDFVDGRSLSAVLGEHGRIPAGVALEIVGELARLLGMAYEFPGPDGLPLELLHRDIKPANIQITPCGDVRLLDFGVARASFSEREAKTTQSITGTPGYMAPERLMGLEGPYGDVYGLGMVLWRMVTGEAPGDRSAQRVERGVAEHTAADPELAPVLELAARMRDLDHEERPTHREVERACRELRQRLPHHPWLRDWAEHIRPHEARPDPLVGSILTQGTLQMDLDGDLPPDSTRSTLLLFTGGTVAVSTLVAVGGLSLIALAFFGLAQLKDSPDEIRFAPPLLQPAEPVITFQPATAPVPEPVRRTVPSPSPRMPRPQPVAEPVAEPDPVPAAPAPVGPPVAITIRSVPWEARAYLDGRLVGRTPLRGIEVPAGAHELRLEHEGATLTRSIEVGPDAPNDFGWRVAEGETGFSSERR